MENFSDENLFAENGDFKYLEDEEEFLDYYRKRRTKIIIIVTISLIVFITFLIALITAKNPYDRDLTLQNDFDNIVTENYYKKN